MAGAEKSIDLQKVLKPFYQRAAEAEERLSRLEAAYASQKGESTAGNEELPFIVKELQSKLESVKSEQISELEKASKELQRLATENLKLQYRISHLVRALKDADQNVGV